MKYHLQLRRLTLAGVVWVVLCSAAALGAGRHASFAAAMESIQCEQLRGYVAYLADDALEGREAGSTGGREAGEHLAGRLRELGLRGAGVDGGFFQPVDPNYRNVLGLLEGCDPELRQQYVVVGAHYDHLGYGTKRNSRGPVGQIHNGADDNASGDSALLELAEAFTFLAEPPKRSILFAFWDAEEKGMLGSKHWTGHPTVPLDRVAAYVNVDMVGRLREDRVFLFATRTGYGWRRLVSFSNQDTGLTLDFPRDVTANGDHWPFIERGIPAVMLHTGLHDQYHTPSDDVELINVEGMQRVTQLLLAITYDLANGEAVPAFRDAAHRERDQDSPRTALAEARPRPPERLGVEWEEQPAGLGVRLRAVTVGSPADKAGLRPGDRVVEFAGRAIQTGEEFAWAVTSAENPVSMVVRRAGHDGLLELSARLDGSPMRLGVAWRVDEAEPGAVVLTQVVAGSPAALAGLKPGDYVYQIGGRDFAGESEFAELARTLPGPLTLLVERDGRLSTVKIELDPERLRQAA